MGRAIELARLRDSGFQICRVASIVTFLARYLLGINVCLAVGGGAGAPEQADACVDCRPRCPATAPSPPKAPPSSTPHPVPQRAEYQQLIAVQPLRALLLSLEAVPVDGCAGARLSFHPHTLCPLPTPYISLLVHWRAQYGK